MPERSQDQDEHAMTSPDHRDLETALGSVAPRAAARVDPVAAAYAAGRRSAAGQLRAWRAASASALIVGVAGWVLRVGDDVAPPTSNHLAPHSLVTRWQSEQPAPPRAAVAPAQSMLMLQEAIREHGVDGLPPSSVPAAPGTRSRDVL